MSGQSGVPDHWLCATIAMTPPICLVPSAQNAVLVPPSSCRQSTARRWPSIFGKSARKVAPGAHAGLVLDGAGWHQAGERLPVPDNISLLSLPPYSPELNPVENIWQFLRGNFLSHQVWNSYDEILAACRNAWNKFMQMPEQIASITQRDWIKKVIG